MKLLDKPTCMTLAALMIIIGCGVKGDMAKSVKPENLFTHPVISYTPIKDTPNFKTLTKEEREFRHSILDLIKKSNKAFDQINRLSEYNVEREGYFKEQREINQQILKEHVILFERAYKNRLEADSTKIINKQLLEVVKENSNKVDEYYKQSQRANGLEKQVKNEKDWYKWTLLFCVIGTLIFTCLSYLRPYKSQL